MKVIGPEIVKTIKGLTLPKAMSNKQELELNHELDSFS